MSATASYEFLVKNHLDDLRKYCFYLTKSKWDGEDLYQEALLKAMIYFLDTKPSQDIKHFLLRVARNLWFDICRARQRRRTTALQDFPVSYSDTDYVEIRSLVEWMAERLPRRNIEMWLLSEYFGYTMQEIADATNSTVAAVKSVLSRTRRELRRLKQGRKSQMGKRAVLRLDVERWTRAVMQDRPLFTSMEK